MIGLNKILKHLIVILVRTRRGDSAVITVIECVFEKEEVRVEKRLEEVDLKVFLEEKKRAPVVIVVTGENVITKELNNHENDLERITGNEGLLWEYVDQEEGRNVLAFTRNDQIAPLLDVMDKNGITPFAFHVRPVQGDDRIFDGEMVTVEENFVLEIIKSYYRNNLRWSVFFESTARGNYFCSLFMKKIKLPLLACLLILLFVNFWINGDLRDKSANARAELSVLEKDVSKRDKLSREVRAVVDEFSSSGNIKVAPVVDKIASRVPENMNLESMEVNPLLKSHEENKPLLIREGLIRLKGTCSTADEITGFTSTVGLLDLVKDVKLLLLEREKETGQFVFKMNVWL